MTPKHLINPCKCDTYHSPMLKLLLVAKHYTRPTRGDAYRINKHKNLLRLDINKHTTSKNNTQWLPEIVQQNISNSEGGECFRKSKGPKTRYQT